MMSKASAASHSLVTGTRKNACERLAKQQVQSAANKRPVPSSSPNEVFVIGNPGTTVEVVVTREGRKSGSTMVSGRKCASAVAATASKPTDESRTNNWSKTLRDQNRSAIKQGLQQLAVQTFPSKRTRHENLERRENKNVIESYKSQNNTRRENIILDEIPVKQAARNFIEDVKTAPGSTVTSTTTIASSARSVVITDKGVQCGGIFDRSNDRFSAFNPVRTIGFLMKEMEGLVRDERLSKILSEMEHALLRVPVESGAAVLDARIAKLVETNAKIESTCAAQRVEVESLLQQVKKQALMLEEAKQRERSLENEVKELKMELNDALKSGAESRRIISQLEKENKSIEATEKLVTDLRRQLNEQIELAEQRFMEGQYLQLEKEKFITLSSYKDSNLIELGAALKELQNHISEQLIDIRKAVKRANDMTLEPHRESVVHGGAACSSPISCSINSIVPASGNELSERSLSSIDCFTNSIQPTKKPFPKIPLDSSSLHTNDLPDDDDDDDDDDHDDDDSEPGKLYDKTQLEFISLPGGETSHAVSITKRKDEEGKSLASCRDKKDDPPPPPPSRGRRVEGFRSVPNVGGTSARDSLDPVDSKDNKNYNSRSKSKTSRKSSSSEKKRSAETRSLLNREQDRREDVDCASGDPASIKQQFELIFQDIRQQSKLPVHMPSPPRDYPRPDWSDSSLPTISGISESNVA